jgi:cytochrome b561
MKHSLPTRLLHLLVAAAVVVQLGNSQLMRVPRPGRFLTGTEAAAFTLHEYVGLASLPIVGLFWLWLLVRRRGTSLGLLIPWFSRQRLAELRDDIIVHVRCAARLTLPEPEHSIALSSAIQGAGLTLALVMAVTGTVGYILWQEGTAMTGFAQALFEVHGTLANVVWGYLIVHVGAALLHEMLGHRMLAQMTPMAHAGVVSRAPQLSPVADGGELPTSKARRPRSAAEPRDRDFGRSRRW